MSTYLWSMTVTSNQIGWSHYGSYEGPFFLGVQRFHLSISPDEADKVMAVITAAEGGHYDAINMYDRGVISVGLIQWIEAGQYSVSNMLGEVAEQCGADAVLVPLKPALDLAGATFKKDPQGKWRFFFNDARGEVDTLDKTRQLFLGCSGLKGSWTSASRVQAKTWAAGVANVFADPHAQHVQNTYTRERLPGFVMADAKRELFDHNPDAGWVGATRAAFMSFAINRPSTANNMVKKAVSELDHLTKWSPDWCIGVIKELTLGPDISIYPIRYNGIRGVLEELWGVKLPASSKELAAWKPSVAAPAPVDVTEPSLPGETAGEKLVRIVERYVGCSLSNRRDELGELVARGVDDPKVVVTIHTNCATTALGIMAKAGVDDPLLKRKYINGMAIAWVRQVGFDRKALVSYTGPSGPQPKPGSLMRYNTKGRNDDHVEWLLTDLAPDFTADHAGGGRADNAITRGHSDIRTNCGRPLVEFWDPDKLGIPLLAAPKVEQQPPAKPVDVAPKPEPAPVEDVSPSPPPEPPDPPPPAPPSPAPIIPAPPPGLTGTLATVFGIIRKIVLFLMTLVGKKPSQ